jgi:hypothetical protein
MNPDDIQTVQDLISYCKETLAENPERMSQTEQEPLAVGLVGACLTGDYQEREQQYPQLEEISAIASNLEWGNVSTVRESWQRIRELVESVSADIKAKEDGSSHHISVW